MKIPEPGNPKSRTNIMTSASTCFCRSDRKRISSFTGVRGVGHVFLIFFSKMSLRVFCFSLRESDFGDEKVCDLIGLLSILGFQMDS